MGIFCKEYFPLLGIPSMGESSSGNWLAATHAAGRSFYGQIDTTWNEPYHKIYIYMTKKNIRYWSDVMVRCKVTSFFSIELEIGNILLRCIIIPKRLFNHQYHQKEENAKFRA